ncbi:hypothetical protein AAFN47_26940 [Hoeflea sp. CAU 1731]
MAAAIHTPLDSEENPHRLQVETDLSEAQNLLKLLEFVAEDAEGQQWLSMRDTVLSTLFTIDDKLKTVDRFVNASGARQ